MPPQISLNDHDEDVFEQFDDDIDWAEIPDEIWNNTQVASTSRTGLGDQESSFASGSNALHVSPTIAPRSRSSSSSNTDPFSDGPYDEAFMTQLDEIEQQLVNNTPSSCEPTLRNPTPPLSSHTLKRSLSPQFSFESTSKKLKDLASPNFSDNSQDPSSHSVFVKSYEDELSCPICFDIFVAPHSTNPCGHSLCGPCGYEWTASLKQTRCPVCRTRLTGSAPIIPNIALDSITEKHVQMLEMTDVLWKPGSKERNDRLSKINKWKREATKRTSEKASYQPRPATIGHFAQLTREPNGLFMPIRDRVRHFHIVGVGDGIDLTDDDGTFEVEEDEDYVDSVYLRAMNN